MARLIVLFALSMLAVASGKPSFGFDLGASASAGFSALGDAFGKIKSSVGASFNFFDDCNSKISEAPPTDLEATLLVDIQLSQGCANAAGKSLGSDALAELVAKIYVALTKVSVCSKDGHKDCKVCSDEINGIGAFNKGDDINEFLSKCELQDSKTKLQTLISSIKTDYTVSEKFVLDAFVELAGLLNADCASVSLVATLTPLLKALGAIGNSIDQGSGDKLVIGLIDGNNKIFKDQGFEGFSDECKESLLSDIRDIKGDDSAWCKKTKNVSDKSENETTKTTEDTSTVTDTQNVENKNSNYKDDTKTTTKDTEVETKDESDTTKEGTDTKVQDKSGSETDVKGKTDADCDDDKTKDVKKDAEGSDCDDNETKDVKNKTDEKKTDEKKTDEKKTDEKKTDEKKTDEKKTDEKKTDEKKTDEKKTDEKKTDEKKTDVKTTDQKETDETKTTQQTLGVETEKEGSAVSKDDNKQGGEVDVAAQKESSSQQADSETGSEVAAEGQKSNTGSVTGVTTVGGSETVTGDSESCSDGDATGNAKEGSTKTTSTTSLTQKESSSLQAESNSESQLTNTTTVGGSETVTGDCESCSDGDATGNGKEGSTKTTSTTSLTQKESSSLQAESNSESKYTNTVTTS